VKIWVTFPNGTKLGAGRARLFDLIDELGSIRKAVAQLGMSYRAAWGYITELEAAAGFTFLARKPGGGGTGGARLTREGALSWNGIAASATPSTRSLCVSSRVRFKARQ